MSYDYRANLEEFLLRMQEVGFEITAFFPYYEGRSYNLLEQYDSNDLYMISRQALNYEHTNIEFTNEDTNNRQIISVMLTGDSYCDVVPINDWSFRRDKVDFVDMFVTAIREEILGDDA